MSFIIDSITSLNHLELNDVAYKEKSLQEELKLHFEELSSEETEYWEGRINRHSLACGCPQGAIAVILTSVCFISYLVLRPFGFYVTWIDGIMALGLFFISGGIGRIIGLKVNREKFRQAIIELRFVLQERKKSKKIAHSGMVS